jgi:hypothetical protein
MSWKPTTTCNGDVPSTNTPPLLQGVLGLHRGRSTVMPSALGGRRIARLDILAILEAAIALVDSAEDDEITLQ